MIATPGRGSWREAAQHYVHETVVEADRRGLQGKAFVRFLRAGYPFGERLHYPYQVWSQEVTRVLVERGLAKPTKSLLRLQRWERGETGRHIDPEERIAAGQLPLIGGE